MTATLTRPPHPHVLTVPSARRWALAGGLWAWGFAAVHGYWAAGGRVGVPRGTPEIWQRPAFLAYDLTAATVLLAAGAVAMLLATPTGGGRRRLFLVHLALVGGAAALLRGGLGLVQDLTGAITGDAVHPVSALVDGWFTVAGALFVVVALRLRETAWVVTRRRS